MNNKNYVNWLAEKMRYDFAPKTELSEAKKKSSKKSSFGHAGYITPEHLKTFADAIVDAMERGNKFGRSASEERVSGGKGEFIEPTTTDTVSMGKLKPEIQSKTLRSTHPSASISREELKSVLKRISGRED